MRFLLAAMLALGAGGLFAAPEPSMRDFVERARVIVHLKVLRVAEEGKPVDPKDPAGRFAPDILECQVKEFVFGALDTSALGRVAMTAASPKGKRDAADVSYSPGVEVTLISETLSPHEKYGTLFDGGGAANRRPSGAPSAELRRLLRNRTDRAFLMIEDLRGPLRDAAESARTQLELRARRKLADLSGLSAEQDLLADMVAVTLGEPALCDCARPDLGRDDRRKLVRLALQHAFGFDADHVDMLAPLFAAQGHGLHALMRPDETSAAVLRGLIDRVEEQRMFASMLAELMRGNGGADYAPWLALLLETSWNRAERIGDLCAEMITEGTLAAATLADNLDAPASEKLPYDSPAARAACRVLDAGANRLFLLLDARGFHWPGDEGVSKKFDRKTHTERAKKAEAAYNSDHALVLLLRLSLDDAGSKEKDRPSAYLASRIQQAQRKAGKTPATLATPKQIAAEAEKRKVKLPEDLQARVEALE